MFEISDLKAMKLPELQKIAETLKIPKYKTQKKLDLVYQILDLQASNPKIVKETAVVVENSATAEAPKARAPKPRPRPKKEVTSDAKDPKTPQHRRGPKEEDGNKETAAEQPKKEHPKKEHIKKEHPKKDHSGNTIKREHSNKAHAKNVRRRRSRATTTRTLKTNTSNPNTNSTVLSKVKGCLILCRMVMDFYGLRTIITYPPLMIFMFLSLRSVYLD